MNTRLGRYFFLAALTAISLITINAQQSSFVVSDLYVVSAEAGGINYVTGDVKVRSGSDRLAIKGDKMASGERMITGTDGRAEVLLNPGSFLRIAQSTDFEFISTNLNDLSIKLVRGTAIIELYSTNGLTVTVFTPDSEFRLMKSGIYRIDVLNGTSKISIWKGNAAIGGASQRTIGKGMSLTVAGGQYSESKFDRDVMDGFDSWSKLRSAEVAALNARLQRNVMQQSILASSNIDWWQSNGSGFWVFDPFSRNHCFVPYGRRGSPYGHNYSQNVGSYNVPPPVTGNTGGSNNNPGDQIPPSGMPRPERGRKHKPDGDDNGNIDEGRDHNRRRDRDADNNNAPANGGSVDRGNNEPRVPRKAREDEDRPVREDRREERRSEDRRSEDRRSDSNNLGSNGNSGGSGNQSSPPPPPPSNSSPPPDPPRNDSIPKRKGDPPR